MSDIAPFVALGFRHITDLTAMDHLLFLVALAAIYRGREWRDAIWVVSAFTAGHSITLALAVSGALALSTTVVEFLIPITIVVTGLANMGFRDHAFAPGRRAYRPVLAGIFGLVHGAGFANYLSGLFDGPMAAPLLGFNLGVEGGQILVLVAIGLALATLDRLLRLGARGTVAPYRLRTVGVSAAVIVVATKMAAERVPW